MLPCGEEGSLAGVPGRVDFGGFWGFWGFGGFWGISAKMAIRRLFTCSSTARTLVRLSTPLFCFEINKSVQFRDTI